MIWAPDPDELLVDESDLLRDEIGEDERGIRHLSDDQSVTVGYAVGQFTFPGIMKIEVNQNLLPLAVLTAPFTSGP